MSRMVAAGLLFALLGGCGGGSGTATGDPCTAAGEGVNWAALAQRNCPQLSDYRLLEADGAPREPGVAFVPPVALFTDYAIKQRAVFVPPGTRMTFDAEAPFAFPEGSVLVKTFLLPASTTGDLPHTAEETRLLIYRQGRWLGLPYRWRDDGSDADLRLGGALLPREILRDGETLAFTYRVPDANQCGVCHQRQLDSGVRAMQPIGVRARYLHEPRHPGGVAQLHDWAQRGLIEGVPADLDGLLRVPAADAADTGLGERARGYLDINCRHCHSDGGGGGLSGLRLGYEEDPGSLRYGVCKQPPGYDGGAAGLDYDIVPGNAAASVLPYRMGHNGARDRMPPLGRSLVHDEGVALISDWIDSLPAQDCDQAGE
ncbi:hypothetical protein [Isoalcanivorax indicus]|uniref:hypothetical protein n=1 Tax=Isoalcanivorax indicus TaxID=2202653 RepID=UPI001B876A64|nr:hypothetical protein [Isoalcanivorax indicus]